MARYMNQITACKTNGVTFVFKACESSAGMSCSALNFQKDVAQLDGVQWKATHIVRGLENMTCEERA